VFNRIGLVILALACSLGAAFSPLEVRYIASGLAPVVPRAITMGAAKSPWVLQPVFAGFSILSPSWLWVILPIAMIAVFLATVLFSRGRFLRIRRVSAWHSATTGVIGPSNYTAFGFANPLRHVLANVLGTTKSVSRHEEDELGESTPNVARVESSAVVVEPVETYIYRPLWRAVLSVATVAKRLQSGRLNAYVAYMLVALLAVLAVVASMK
jgi:hypothetical protein